MIISLNDSQCCTLVQEQTLDVQCSGCGKRYVKRSSTAGGTTRCRGCRGPLRVPGGRTAGQISERTRAVVLAELGLEPEQAEAAYLDEALLSYADQPVPVFPVEELEERSESQAVSDETRALPRTQVLRSLGYWVFLVLGLSMFMDVVCTLPYSVCVALALVLATAAALQIGQAPRGARLQGPGLPVAAH